MPQLGYLCVWHPHSYHTEFSGKRHTPLGACPCVMHHCAAELAAPVWDKHPMKVVEAIFKES